MIAIHNGDRRHHEMLPCAVKTSNSRGVVRTADSQFDAPFSDANSKERCWLIGSSVFSCEAVTLWRFCLVCFAFFFWRLRSSKISPISSSCLVIFVMRGAVTCSELLYSALAIFNGLDMPRPPCRGGRSSIACSLSRGGLRPVRLGIRCCHRQSSSGCSKSQMLSMVRDRNVHLLAKPLCQCGISSMGLYLSDLRQSG